MKVAFDGRSVPDQGEVRGPRARPELVDRLKNVRLERNSRLPATVRARIADDRDTRRQSAVSAAVDCDLLILVIDGRKSLQPADVAFAQAWDRHYIEHPQREAPPTLVVDHGS